MGQKEIKAFWTECDSCGKESERTNRYIGVPVGWMRTSKKVDNLWTQDEYHCPECAHKMLSMANKI